MVRGAILLAMLLAACAPVPQRTGLASTWRPSPNFDARLPSFVVIHHTGDDTAARALATLTDPLRAVSSHYLVARNGAIYQLVDERARAWHAGVSRWGAQVDLNSASIGIELDNDGEEPFAEPQVASLLALLADLKQRYRIPTANFIGHGDVAPGRKTDPSRYFPWQRLAEQGFGVWCDATTAPPAPPGFDAALALQALGYDVSRLDAAARAFNRHFRGTDESAALDPAGEAMLACLVARLREAPSP